MKHLSDFSVGNYHLITSHEVYTTNDNMFKISDICELLKKVSNVIANKDNNNWYRVADKRDRKISVEEHTMIYGGLITTEINVVKINEVVTLKKHDINDSY